MVKKQKIRVAFFSDILLEDFDGAVRTMYQIINRIPGDRFEFMFFTGITPRKKMSSKVVKVPSVTIPFNSNYKAALPFLASGKIDKRIKKFKPDIIHIASPSPLGNHALQLGQEMGIPVLTIYHTHFLSYVEYYLRSMPFLVNTAKDQVIKSNKKFYDQCDAVLIPTQTMKDELRSYGFNASRFMIWGRGIDRQIFNPAKKDVKRLNKITGNKNPKIVFASRLVWEKNLKTLIKIYHRIEKQKLPYQMIIVGDGVAKEELERVMPNAYFFGHVDHQKLAFIYASSFVFCFTSVSESYGNVLIEAMSSGLPCVAAAGGGSLSLIEDGRNGYLVDPNKPKSYLEKIELLRSSERRYNDVVQFGLQYTKHLSWDSLVDQYFAKIEDMITR